MKLIDLPPSDALGTLLAHAQDGLVDGRPMRLKKGTVLTSNDIRALQAKGHASVTVAKLDVGDVHEDEAAFAMAKVVCGNQVKAATPFTGRANLYAKQAGLFIPEIDMVNQINGCHPSVTLATLPPHTAVEAGRMIATIKVIPFAVPGSVLKSCLAVVTAGAVSVAPFRSAKVGLVSTRLPTLKESTMDKTRTVLERRLAVSNSHISHEMRTAHEIGEVSDAIRALSEQNCELILLFGASAMIDADDVLPQALRQSGGTVDCVGMPVDPGNLLFLGDIAGTPVIGAPGCARSPAENGFDWVLNRILANVSVGKTEIAGMGVGGLLMEIVSRPQPRHLEPNALKHSPNIAALLLAAGQSKRMGPNNKLTAEVDGKPLVRHVADAAIGAVGNDLTVVTGSQPDQVAAAFQGLSVTTVFNPNFEQGLSTSLCVGINALANRDSAPDAVLVLLGDMPQISQGILKQLVKAFDPANGRHIIVPTDSGKRGNPVLWSARFFDALTRIQGDTGARHLIGEYAEFVHEVEVGQAVSFDLDTPDQMKQVGGRFTD